MLKSGLVSVSFRALSCGEILRRAAEAGLRGIEWGGDVHVPPADPARAAEVGAMTRDMGLSVAAYGSYYRLGNYGADYRPVFQRNLAAAKALGAPVIRLWAGTAGSAATDAETRRALVREAKAIALLAADIGIAPVFECHPDTLTDHRLSAIRLMEEIGRPGIGMYWQPNDGYDFAYNLQALRDLLPYLANLHVFQWPSPGRRASLQSGEAEWKRYLAAAAADGKDRWCLLEFMPDDEPGTLPREAQTLNTWLREINEPEGR